MKRILKHTHIRVPGLFFSRFKRTHLKRRLERVDNFMYELSLKRCLKRFENYVNEFGLSLTFKTQFPLKRYRVVKTHLQQFRPV